MEGCMMRFIMSGKDLLLTTVSIMGGALLGTIAFSLLYSVSPITNIILFVGECAGAVGVSAMIYLTKKEKIEDDPYKP